MIYMIRRGDTLSALAKRYNTTVARLVADNNIADPNKIYAGRTLVINAPSSFDTPQPWNLRGLLRDLWRRLWQV